MDGLRRLDHRGIRRGSLSRRDFFVKSSTAFESYVPREVCAEFELHDKVATLEATVARLESERR